MVYHHPLVIREMRSALDQIGVVSMKFKPIRCQQARIRPSDVPAKRIAEPEAEFLEEIDPLLKCDPTSEVAHFWRATIQAIDYCGQCLSTLLHPCALLQIYIRIETLYKYVTGGWVKRSLIATGEFGTARRTSMAGDGWPHRLVADSPR